MQSDRPDSARWYAVQTKPKQEARAESNLRRWGIETLAPKMCTSRPPSPVVGPRSPTFLFPNYLFACFDAFALITKIRLTRGVQRVVGLGEYATPIEDSVIALIRSRIGDDGFVQPVRAQRGDVVEIVDGPLRSLVGIFERELPARDRVLILLTTIAARARVEVARSDIRKVEACVA